MWLLLNVDNLTKIFTVGLLRKKEIIAVKEVSFQVNSGKFVSLVGESGSGKTTTAKMILKLIQPTSGKIFFEDKDVTTLSKYKELKEYWSKVHGIFQDPYASFNPLQKADRVLYQAFELINDKNIDRDKAVREALREVGLNPEEVLGKYPHELSGGQRQRIMVARCYLIKPKLIVADEPVSMIDASTREGIIQLLSNLREEYKTSVIFITHDLGLAYYVSDEMLIMYKGQIVEKGSPEEIIDHPTSEYTKRLKADIPLLYRKWEEF
ncbi:MAG: ABC transporter ATP-binding protein [Thermoproteota archaeon]|jgi:peptide/nickel transport system ATP-binding protein